MPSNLTFKVFTEKLGGRPVEEFIAPRGELFYDPDTSTLRRGDGVTPGGIILASGVASGNVVSGRSEIVFSANSSGDGLGYSTIEFIPDNTINPDQSIIIDPTTPNHIHIRAGGQQGNSSAELYLGGEDNYVKVVDNIGVFIRGQNSNDQSFFYDNTLFTDATWFSENGSHFVQFTSSNIELTNHFWSFPNDNRNQLIVYSNGNSYNLTYGGWAGTISSNTRRVQVNEPPVSVPFQIDNLEFLLFTNFTSSINLENRDVSVITEDDFRVQASDEVQFVAGRNIEFYSNDIGSSYRWVMREDGGLEFPFGGVLGFRDLPPASSIGTDGDVRGIIAFSNTHFYYCTGTFNGTSEIWKRIAFDHGNW